MNREQPIQAAIRDLFQNYVGRGKAVEIGELARLSDITGAQVYEYSNGKYLGSATALVRLCQQNDEAWAALQSLVEKGAQQTHGDELELLSEVGRATGEIAAHAAKGRFCHRARTAVINTIRRLKGRCGLYLAFHSRERAA